MNVQTKGEGETVARNASEIPNKLFYKIGEVCEITDTQPYVLRFWESEFPQLAPRKNRSGQRVYQRKDIETVIRIKKLLYEEEYTIAGARRKLDEEPGGAAPSDEPEAAPAPAARQATAAAAVAREEADHPVDLLPGRAEEPRARAARGAPAAAVADPDRAARLEAALAEVKTSLGELLELLRKE